MATSSLSESFQSEGHCRIPEEQEEFWQEDKITRAKKESERRGRVGLKMLTGGWNNTGALLCVFVCRSRKMFRPRQPRECVEEHGLRYTGCQRRFAAFNPVSVHLPGEANWVRQMEQKHESILIPFEDFDDKRNLQPFRVSWLFF